MIQINHLTKKYGQTVILDDTSFAFGDKGLVCLLGASGCGKSTLLNLLAGFDSDYSGEITVCNTNIGKMNKYELCAYRRDHIGFVFQNYHLLSGYTVLENIMLPCEANGLNKQENEKKARQLLSGFGMPEKADEKTENLSGGQKQRAAIARALICNPSIILADEPTGALDRHNSTEIMTLLQSIAKEKLVVVITHDPKICEFADEVISIKNGKITTHGEVCKTVSGNSQKLIQRPSVKIPCFKRGLKNFKAHVTRYIAVSLTISFGVLCFVLSLSSGNIMQSAIADFKEKNTAFNNGYIRPENENAVLELLAAEDRIENVYRQYKINGITLSWNGSTETMAEKYPMPKSTESMSYGIMPKKVANEIALTPSLAKKLSSNISSLVGEKITLQYGGKDYLLTVSGIFNAGYDDFFVSADVEQEFYKGKTEEPCYSISYDVKNFEDIVSVSKMLSEKNIDSKNAANEVEALQNTFYSLSRLFFIVSILILIICLFISVVLLVKLQRSRYKELGLLSALGFTTGTIQKIIVSENILLSAAAAIFNALLIGCAVLVGIIFNIAVHISLPQMILSIFLTGITVVVISLLASYKLLHTEPAIALRK